MSSAERLPGPLPALAQALRDLASRAEDGTLPPSIAARLERLHARQALADVAETLAPGAAPWRQAVAVEGALRWFERQILPLVRRSGRALRPGLEVALGAALEAWPTMPRGHRRLYDVLCDCREMTEGPGVDSGCTQPICEE